MRKEKLYTFFLFTNQAIRKKHEGVPILFLSALTVKVNNKISRAVSFEIFCSSSNLSTSSNKALITDSNSIETSISNKQWLLTMLLLFSVFIVLHHIFSLSGDLSVVLQGVTPLNSVAINITWMVESSGQSNSTTDGTIKLEIDVCGISSTSIVLLPTQNPSSINVQNSITVSGLQPDAVYHACLGANWTSANNNSYSFQYPCVLVRTFMAGQYVYWHRTKWREHSFFTPCIAFIFIYEKHTFISINEWNSTTLKCVDLRQIW